MEEKILTPSNDRFVLFPIEHVDIWELYKKALSSFWTAEEIDFSRDIKDWEEKLNDKERFFIKNVLAFFAASDGIVNENLALKFYNEVQVPEIRNLYATQIQMEAIHSECVTGDTLILTERGYVKIKDVCGEAVKVYNGYKFVEVLIEDKGEKDIYSVKLSNGIEIKCSDNHVWLLSGKEKKTTELTTKDYIVKHWITDEPKNLKTHFLNTRNHAYYSLQESDIFASIGSFFNFYILRSFDHKKYFVPVNYCSKIKIEWFRGLLDSDYTILHKKDDLVSLYVISTNAKFLQDIQLMLTTMDIYSDFCEGKNSSCLKLNNNSVYEMYKKGLLHPKITQFDIKCSIVDFPQIINVVDVKNLGIREKTYCFHEKENGTALFNCILTKQCYSLMIDTYIKNKDEKMQLFKSLETNPIVSKKASWALKWINDSQPFAERLIAFCAVEGIFFSGSFCSIFWLKSRGLMPSLTLSNQFISRDESLHCETCVAIYGKLSKKLSTEKIHQIFKEAYEIECEFITESLPVSLIGMNAKLMKEYIQFITDYWLVKLGYPKLFNVKNPFSFMNYISMENKTNFFENRVSEYSKVMNTNEIFNTEEDF